jgi:hypothetical protein
MNFGGFCSFELTSRDCSRTACTNIVTFISSDRHSGGQLGYMAIVFVFCLIRLDGVVGTRENWDLADCMDLHSWGCCPAGGFTFRICLHVFEFTQER